MKYLVKFWDKHEKIVSEKAGNQIKLAKEKNIERIKIGDALYETKAISYIEPIKIEVPKPLQLQAPSNTVKKETIERLKKEMAARFNWK